MRSSAWVAAAAPWASRTSAERVERIDGSVVQIGAGEQSFDVPIAFDMGEAGLSCEWHDDLLVVFAGRPPGPERAVIESWSGGSDVADLERAMAERVEDAFEAAIQQVDTTTWLDAESFHWLAVAGAQHHAVAWKWQRGLYTTVVLVDDVLVSLTTPEADPSRNLRLRDFLRSFRLDHTPAVDSARARIVDGDREVPLVDHDELSHFVGMTPRWRRRWRALDGSTDLK